MTHFTAAVLAASLLASIAVPPAAAEPVQKSGEVFHRRLCAEPAVPAKARCHARVVTDALGAPVLTDATLGALPRGYGPADLRAAYNMTGAGSPDTLVAVVEAFGSNSAEDDLAVYRSAYGLPPCTSANGCFTRVGQNGGAPSKSAHGAPGLGWAMETVLDLEMVSAMCPACKLLVVEANTDAYADLGDAVNTAANLGARVIANSYGGDEGGTLPFGANYDHPGVAVVASAGDTGYGVQFPAASPFVTAVGGTRLAPTGQGARGWSESAWAGSGSGCSALYAKPAWQRDPLCPKRMVADVSAVADPATGVAVFAPTATSKSAWQVFGGTSVAASVIAGVYGANGGPASYGADPYAARGAALNDVTSGSNGACAPTAYYCTAGKGYDGPTGLGTPNGAAAF